MAGLFGHEDPTVMTGFGVRVGVNTSIRVESDMRFTRDMRLTVKVSEDDGITWRQLRRLERRFLAEGCVWVKLGRASAKNQFTQKSYQYDTLDIHYGEYAIAISRVYFALSLRLAVPDAAKQRGTAQGVLGQSVRSAPVSLRDADFRVTEGELSA